MAAAERKVKFKGSEISKLIKIFKGVEIMKFRKAVVEDIDGIMEIINAAQNYLAEQGIDQWQNNYPNSKTLKKDIKNDNLYVLEKKNEVAAAAAVIFGEDPTYNYIENGGWLSDGFYGVIHRAAVAPEYKGRGLVSEIFNETYKMGKELGAESIRIDTHPHNLPMQRAIEKENFSYCGVIYIEDGSKRLAYEKLLK